MMESNFKPIHRFFHGDPLTGHTNMYSMSVGDTWLYFSDNRFVGVCHLSVKTDVEDEFYILESIPDNEKEAMRMEFSNASVVYGNIDEIVGHALRLVSNEISTLIAERLLPNPTE